MNVTISASMDVIKRDTGRNVDVDCEGRRFSRGNASLLFLRRSMETETASISIALEFHEESLRGKHLGTDEGQL